jgi:TPR repeat protein
MSLNEIGELEYNLTKAVSNKIKIPITESIRLIMNAANKGHPDAMYDMGCYYFYGYSNILDKNVECAIYMWRKASSQGHVDAHAALYHYHNYGKFNKPRKYYKDGRNIHKS